MTNIWPRRDGDAEPARQAQRWTLRMSQEVREAMRQAADDDAEAVGAGGMVGCRGKIADRRYRIRGFVDLGVTRVFRPHSAFGGAVALRTLIRNKLPQRYWTRSLPFSSGSLFSIFIVTLHAMQVRRFISGLSSLAWPIA